MVRVAGRPFLEYELRLLKKNGIRDFVISIGYKAEVIEEYFSDGESLGISISYSDDGERKLGPAGAIKNAADLLEREFMVIYGDTFLQMDFQRFEKEFRSSGKLGMMSVLENNNRFGKSDIAVSEGLVTEYDKKQQKKEMSWINYGASMLQKRALDYIPPSTEVGEEAFYQKLISKGELAAFVTFTRFYEIGSISALREFEMFTQDNPKLLDE
jgi:NDP-sugar pyrophosphorylase family protein